MENHEYLSVKEVSALTGYQPQSIYNMIHKKTFILNQHYFKPTRKKIMFKRDAVKQWIEGTDVSESTVQQMNIAPSGIKQRQNQTDSATHANKINI